VTCPRVALSKLGNGRTLTALISIANSLTLATISNTVSGRFSDCLLRSFSDRSRKTMNTKRPLM
jgi:hypothetical protein